jgi:hypothetical protein
LITVPATPVPAQPEETLADVLKRLIANSAEKIKLNDFVSGLLRQVAERLSERNFPPSQPFTPEEFLSRIQRYEEAVADLAVAVVLLAHWGEPDHMSLLEKIFARAAEFDKPQAGLNHWIHLSWYPLLILMYVGGISALAANRVDALRVVLLTRVLTPRRLLGKDESPVELSVILELNDVIDLFKILPDMERKYVPRSEHMYKKVQPILEDQLFLGRSYDRIFDDFEIMLALSFADLRDEEVTQHVWGPPGRYLWKERGRLGSNPVFTEFVERTKQQGAAWPPLKEGFFRGSAARFAAVADAFASLLKTVNIW